MLPVGCGHHPAILGPCACCASFTIHFPEAKPACGPPDFDFPNSGVFARGSDTCCLFECPRREIDLTQMGKVYASGSFRFFETYSIVAYVYLLLTVGLSLGLRGLEKRLRRAEAERSANG